MEEGTLFSTPSLAFVHRLVDHGPDPCEVLPHCGFGLHFSNGAVEHLLMHLLAIGTVFFAETSG